MVPPHETAVEGLHRYLANRHRLRIAGDNVFVSNSGDPLRYIRVHEIFRKPLKSAGIQPHNGRWPRIHELRHIFAARALESSPTGRRSIGQHMLALATYMGQVNIDSTFWYLSATPDLMEDIALAGESFLNGGRS